MGRVSAALRCHHGSIVASGLEPTPHSLAKPVGAFLGHPSLAAVRLVFVSYLCPTGKCMSCRERRKFEIELCAWIPGLRPTPVLALLLVVSADSLKSPSNSSRAHCGGGEDDKVSDEEQLCRLRIEMGRAGYTYLQGVLRCAGEVPQSTQRVGSSFRSCSRGRTVVGFGHMRHKHRSTPPGSLCACLQQWFQIVGTASSNIVPWQKGTGYEARLPESWARSSALR